jgi:hypothetical protein
MEGLILATLDEVVKLLKEIGNELIEANEKLDKMQSSQMEKRQTDK